MHSNTSVGWLIIRYFGPFHHPKGHLHKKLSHAWEFYKIHLALIRAWESGVQVVSHPQDKGWLNSAEFRKLLRSLNKGCFTTYTRVAELQEVTSGKGVGPNTHKKTVKSSNSQTCFRLKKIYKHFYFKNCLLKVLELLCTLLLLDKLKNTKSWSKKYRLLSFHYIEYPLILE